MSRSTSGVRPRTRPSTRTCAPAGVDRTTSRPGRQVGARPRLCRRTAAARRAARARAAAAPAARSAAEWPPATADCARRSPRAPPRAPTGRRRRRRGGHRWRVAAGRVDRTKRRPVAPAKSGGDPDNQRHDQRQEGSPRGRRRVWRHQRRRRPRAIAGAPRRQASGRRPSLPARTRRPRRRWQWRQSGSSSSVANRGAGSSTLTRAIVDHRRRVGTVVPLDARGSVRSSAGSNGAIRDCGLVEVERQREIGRGPGLLPRRPAARRQQRRQRIHQVGGRRIAVRRVLGERPRQHLAQLSATAGDSSGACTSGRPGPDTRRPVMSS